MNETNHTTTTNGRDTGGRFATGNKGGPGNPFARQTAEMRKAIQNAISREQLAAIAAVLIQKALDGDVSAARLVFSYAAGKPGPTPDPDTLDAHDLAVRRENTATTEDIGAIFKTMPAEILCNIAAVTVPHVHEQMTKQFSEGLKHQEERDRQEAQPRCPRKKDRAPRRPTSTNSVPDRESRLGPPSEDMFRDLPRNLLRALVAAEVIPCHLVPPPDCKRSKPVGPEAAPETPPLNGRP